MITSYNLSCIHMRWGAVGKTLIVLVLSATLLLIAGSINLWWCLMCWDQLRCVIKHRFSFPDHSACMSPAIIQQDTRILGTKHLPSFWSSACFKFFAGSCDNFERNLLHLPANNWKTFWCSKLQFCKKHIENFKIKFINILKNIFLVDEQDPGSPMITDHSFSHH